MPASIVNEEAWNASCAGIVATAQAVLEGNLGIIEGSRKLSPYRFDVKAEKDPDFIFFVGLDSETDHLPLGEVHKKWNPEILKQKQAEINSYESSFKEKAFEACRNLIKKYQK